jgi:hypothetical protein
MVTVMSMSGIRAWLPSLPIDTGSSTLCTDGPMDTSNRVGILIRHVPENTVAKAIDEAWESNRDRDEY